MASASFIDRLGFRGRAPRLEWWLTSIGVGLGRFVALIVVSVLSGQQASQPLVMMVLRPAIDLAFLWPSAVVVVRRGHDRNRPALYSATILAIVYAPSVMVGFLMYRPASVLGGICVLTILIGWIYMAVDYGLLDGTPGPNRYGPSPKGSQGIGVELAQTFD